MNPRTKAGERISEAPRENPAAVFRRSGGESPLRTAEEISILERFLRTDFRRGTIVDYAHGTGFGLECRRNTIDGFFIEGNQMTITSGKLFWMHDDFSRLRIEERGGVFHVSGPDFLDCAIAKEGVAIPKKETLAEAIEDSARLLQEGMGRHAAGLPSVSERFHKTDFIRGTAVVYAGGADVRL